MAVTIATLAFSVSRLTALIGSSFLVLIEPEGVGRRLPVPVSQSGFVWLILDARLDGVCRSVDPL